MTPISAKHANLIVCLARKLPIRAILFAGVALQWTRGQRARLRQAAIRQTSIPPSKGGEEMLMDEYEDEALAARITKAFAGVPYPGDDRLAKVPSEEDRMLRGECLVHWVDGGVSIAFAGKHWQELSVDFLTTHLDALYDFTPEAFRFYLPAYLLAAVRLSEAEAQTGAANIQETLAYKLFPYAQAGYSWDVFQARMRLLTVEQKAAVREFLRWHDRGVIAIWAAIRPELARRGEEDEYLVAMRKYWESIEQI